MAPLREQSVSLGVEFLTHPNVLSHSREDKTSFLRGKGLTGDEIDEAFKRAGGGEVEPQQQQQQQPVQQQLQPQQQAYYPPPPQQEESWASFLLSSLIPASLAVSSGASLLYFYKNHVLHDQQQQQQQLGGFFPSSNGMLLPPPLEPPPLPQLQPNPTVAPLPPWMPQPPPPTAVETARLPHSSPTAADFAEALSSPSTPAPPNSSSSSGADTQQLLRDTLDALKQTVDLLNQQQQQQPIKSSGGNDLQSALPLILQAMQSSSEVKAELSAIKSLLLAQLLSGKSPATNGTTNSNSDDNNNNNTAALVQQLLESSAATPPTAAVAAVEQQEEAAPSPSPSSASVDSSDASTTSTSSSAKEEAAAKKAEELVSKARAALEDMVAQSATGIDQDTAASGYGMLIMFFKNLLKDAMNPRYRRIAKGNANYAKLLQPIPGHGKFLETAGFEERGGSFELCAEWTQDLQEQTNGFARQVLAESVTSLEAHRDKARGGGGGGVAPAAAAPVAAAAATEDSSSPSYPVSFEEIIRLQKEGKRPAGIKDIPNDRLSQDAPSQPAMQPQPKPWEVSNKPKVEITQLEEEEEEEEESSSSRSPILE